MIIIIRILFLFYFFLLAAQSNRRLGSDCTSTPDGQPVPGYTDHNYCPQPYAAGCDTDATNAG